MKRALRRWKKKNRIITKSIPYSTLRTIWDQSLFYLYTINAGYGYSINKIDIKEKENERGENKMEKENYTKKNLMEKVIRLNKSLRKRCSVCWVVNYNNEMKILIAEHDTYAKKFLFPEVKNGYYNIRYGVNEYRQPFFDIERMDDVPVDERLKLLYEYGFRLNNKVTFGDFVQFLKSDTYKMHLEDDANFYPDLSLSGNKKVGILKWMMKDGSVYKSWYTLKGFNMKDVKEALQIPYAINRRNVFCDSFVFNKEIDLSRV